MTTITLKLTGTCPGNGHLDFTVGGDISYQFKAVSIPDLADDITEEEAQAWLKVTAKMAKKGRTMVQTKQLLSATVTVTI